MEKGCDVTRLKTADYIEITILKSAVSFSGIDWCQYYYLLLLKYNPKNMRHTTDEFYTKNPW